MVRVCIATAVAALALALAQSAAAAVTFTVQGSAQQVDVTGLGAGQRMSLINASGHTVATLSADSLGGLLFRNVKPGSGYRVRPASGGEASSPVSVHSNAAAPWDPSIYNQTINSSGYQYLTVRDGIKLAIDVHPPTDVSDAAPAGIKAPALGSAPRPTLIEYAGYGYANPAGPDSGISILANLMGFTVVDVNMRGTGCSGGAYDFFEPLQQLDGYDVIETIAHQPWVLGHKVGMMGISYGAISQLFTAAYNPPDLEAISPLSTIDTTATTLYPGGILNTGFAVAWAEQRQQEAQPAPDKGTQPYATKQIDSGDQTCKSNQVMHGEAASLIKKIKANSHYIASVADSLDPITFVHKINVPVFMACQWEDEQTGGHCPDLAQHMTGTRFKWFTFTNGAHIDSLDPATFNRWYDFLELFVAHQSPMTHQAGIRGGAPAIYQAAMGLPATDAVTLPSDPIQQQPTYQGALSAFEALPQIRVLFDNGAGTSPTGQQTPGNPYPGFEQSFSRWPIPGTTARFFYLGARGALAAGKPARKQINSYTSNAKALPLTDYGPDNSSGGLWGNASQWKYSWNQWPARNAVSYVTPPLKSNTAVIGAGAVHVWVRSSKPDVDLLATVTEVRPDGNETFVQNGYMRASERKLTTSLNNIFKQPSTLLAPIPSELASDVRPMPKGKFVQVVIPMYYEGHAYRAGSRIRLTISAPNGTQPIWAFTHTVPKGTAKVSVEFSKKTPSSLILPVVPGVSVPTGEPPCPSLRNEPCRPYVALTNRVSKS